MTEAFDDPAAELSLGTAASPAVLLGPAENDPATLDVYTTRIPFLVPAPTDLQLLISPAASTQGAGRVILQALLS